ncbi:MAG: quinone oxidoreductase, partial [Kiritimatiellaceae bacterium]|nr:quinone oxidoreductase [Kiritimatiellaceae bacterium]
MKAMLINAYGENAVFTAGEIAKPVPSSGQVLIKIAASSVNPIDTKIRKLGKALAFAPDLPAVLGRDFAGTIESVGDAVQGYQVGDEVYGCAGGPAT